jgi:hypothetical protein
MLIIRRLFAFILLLVLLPVFILIVILAFIFAAVAALAQVIGNGLMSLIILMVKGLGKIARVDTGLDKKQ